MAVRYSNIDEGGYIQLDVQAFGHQLIQKEVEEDKQEEKSQAPLCHRVLKYCPHLPAVLLIFYAVPMVILFAFSITVIAIIFSEGSCSSSEYVDKTIYLTVVVHLVADLFIFIGFPIAGWLADTKFGRYKVINASLWLLWIAMIVLVLGSLLYQYTDECRGVHYIGKYGLLPLSLILFSLGVTGFFPNILAFLMDQLEDVSNSTLSRYVRWFAWSIFVGLFFGYLLVLPRSFNLNAVRKQLPIIAIWMAVLSSVVLIIHFSIESLYTKPLPKKYSNPYKIIYGVLKYTWKHKVPVKRSAFTYWEEEVPKRFDLAKEKYGGPYTTENVEDVKTFGRIMLLTLALSVYYIPFASLNTQTIPFLQHLHHTTDLQYRQWIIYLLDPIVTILAIPILELVILQLYPKFEFVLMKPFFWITLGTVFLLLSNISYLIIDVVAHKTSSKPGVCFLRWVVNDATESLSYGWVAIPTFFWGVSDLLIAPSIFFFLCSQAPYNMRGMILGLFVAIQEVAFYLGIIIAIPFRASKQTLPFDCGIWYWGLISLLSVFGIVTFVIGARFYKRRERQEIGPNVSIIESIYERQLQQEHNRKQMKQTKINI